MWLSLSLPHISLGAKLLNRILMREGIFSYADLES
jgi:hypothetical protein